MGGTSGGGGFTTGNLGRRRCNGDNHGDVDGRQCLSLQHCDWRRRWFFRIWLCRWQWGRLRRQRHRDQYGNCGPHQFRICFGECLRRKRRQLLCTWWLRWRLRGRPGRCGRYRDGNRDRQFGQRDRAGFCQCDWRCWWYIRFRWRRRWGRSEPDQRSKRINEWFALSVPIRDRRRWRSSEPIQRKIWGCRRECHFDADRQGQRGWIAFRNGERNRRSWWKCFDWDWRLGRQRHSLHCAHVHSQRRKR